MLLLEKEERCADCSWDDFESPGPLQRRDAGGGTTQGSAGGSYHSAGCEELQAIHKLVHQLQQVGKFVALCPLHTLPACCG
jgi:hypothetical protein